MSYVDLRISSSISRSNIVSGMLVKTCRYPAHFTIEELSNHLTKYRILDLIIRNYIPSLKIIEQIIRDRRYKRGVVVKVGNTCSTHEELLISVLINEGFEPTPLDLEG